MGPAQQEIRPGTVLGNRYRVLGHLGKGGMGSVVAAEDPQSGRRVAIKCLLSGLCDSLHLVTRFRREARATIRLRSEHVAHVLDAGEHQTSSTAPPIPYLVMEHLEGHDLRAVMRDGGGLSPEQAADYVTQACAGLAEAHALGIVHRDLKPANLFLARVSDGREVLKILDFGVAKFESPSTSGDNEDMTASGETVGSFSYMAPEQIVDASTVDSRADIWSLGVLLYHLVAGEKPFNGDNAVDIATSIITGVHHPLHQRRPNLPPAFTKVVDKCLEKRRENRYGSVVDLARALSPFTVHRTWSAAEAQMYSQTARLSADAADALRAAADAHAHVHAGSLAR